MDSVRHEDKRDKVTFRSSENLLSPEIYKAIFKSAPFPLYALGMDLAIYDASDSGAELIRRHDDGSVHVFPPSRLEYLRQTISETPNQEHHFLEFRSGNEGPSLFYWILKKEILSNYSLHGFDAGKFSLDPITNLKNRAFMETAFNFYNSSHNPTTLFFIDLNNLKEANDKFGHGVGDKKIIADSIIVKHCLRQSDILVRWGGDEFLGLFDGLNDQETAIIKDRLSHVQWIIRNYRNKDKYKDIPVDKRQFYDKIVDEITAEMEERGIELDSFIGISESDQTTMRQLLGFSVGIETKIPGQQDTLLVLADRADRKMYDEKSNSKMILTKGESEASLKRIFPN